MNPQRFKGLRNEEGASPGGGAAPPNGAPAPNGSPPAQGAGSPDVASIVKAVVTETFGELKNSLFADLRKSGALGKGKDEKDTGGSGTPAATPPAATQQQASTPTSALSMDDVNRMMERRDALHGAIPSSLSAGARQRMLKDFARDNPEDPAAWAKGYLSDFGLDKSNGTATPTQNTPNQNQSSSAPPASNGSPPPAPPPAPNASIVTDRPVDVLQWDHDMMAKFYASEGGNPRDFSDPRNAKIWEKVAKMTEAAAARLTLVMERRK